VHVGHVVRLTSGPHRRARRTAYGHIHVWVQHATSRQTEVVAVVRSDGRTCTWTTASAGLAAGSAAAAEVVVVAMVAATADVVVATVV
jgi:6-phosphofructokinase